MPRSLSRWFALSLTYCMVTAALPGQAPPPPPPPAKNPEAVPPPKVVPLPPPPAAAAVAAVVNGQPIPELSVYRALMRENPAVWKEARKEVLDYLVDNVLIDQYLRQLKMEVAAAEVEKRITQITEEAKKNGQDFKKIMEKLHLSEDDLRRELTAALRWDQFVTQQGTEKVLRDLFEKNKSMFDGTQMQARHILLPVAAGKTEEAKAKIAVLRKSIEDQVAADLAKVPPSTDPVAREKQRMESMAKHFAAVAAKESTCPSKANGGDLGWFPRAGAMVEPFARAAFALKPYQMSDAVPTEFGYHLIMAVDFRPGRDVKFEDVRPFVLDVYAERLRQAVIASYKPRSKVELK